MKTENGSATEYVYNALNQLVSDSETTYEYDLNGNLIRVIGSAQSALYEYNSENKLVKTTVQNGVLVTEETYTYDYSGNRTSKTTHRSDGVTEYVKYINDNSSLTNVLAEIGSEGSVQAYYTIGADLISQERDGNVSVYLYDGHGSVVGLANENGKVTDTYAYDAFGNLLKAKPQMRYTLRMKADLANGFIIAYIKGLLHGHHLWMSCNSPIFVLYFINVHKRQILRYTKIRIKLVFV